MDNCRKGRHSHCRLGALTVAALVATFFALSALVGPAFGAPSVTFRFAVTDDSRAEGGRGAKENGVSTVVVNAIARDMAAQRVELVLFPGDMVSGTTDPDRLDSMLKTWKKAMAPVYDAGIPVYVTRGNHEYRPAAYGAGKSSDPGRAPFLANFPMPANGPSGEKGLTYSFTHKNATFIAFDQYIGRLGSFDNTLFAPGSNRGQMMNPWVLSELNRSTSGVNFVFAHEMMFPSNHADCMANDPDSRDALVHALGRHNGAYFAGHDHLYIRGTITDGTGRAVPSFVIGTAGAGNYDFSGKAAAAPYPSAPRYQIQKVLAHKANPYFGYLLVTVYSDHTWSAQFRGFRFNKWNDPSDTSLTPITVLDSFKSSEVTRH